MSRQTAAMTRGLPCLDGAHGGFQVLPLNLSGPPQWRGTDRRPYRSIPGTGLGEHGVHGDAGPGEGERGEGQKDRGGVAPCRQYVGTWKRRDQGQDRGRDWQGREVGSLALAVSPRALCPRLWPLRLGLMQRDYRLRK